MRLFGLEIGFAKTDKALQSVNSRGSGWFGTVHEPFAGAWQRNVEWNTDSVLSFHAVYACLSMISSDIAKLRLKHVKKGKAGIWSEQDDFGTNFNAEKPNGWQNRIQFFEQWMLSKLVRGNTYVLKERDERGRVARLYVLDPQRVTPMIADDGSVFYNLSADTLSRLEAQILVPQSEIIHDRMNCLFHPIVGISPLFANGLAAQQGLNIQTDSATFFENRSTPSGILTAPGGIADDTAERLKSAWLEKFSGRKNSGKIAVVGDGLKFEPLTMTAEDAQLIEQLKWSAQVVCSTFHMPPYKLGIGEPPKYNNIQALNVEYYSQCLQQHIESIEICLDHGLELPKNSGTEFDLDGLLRMDAVTQMGVVKEGISAAVYSPNEGRRKFDLMPVEGGESPFLQEQNFSLSALAKRDAQADPFDRSGGAAKTIVADEQDESVSDEELTKRLAGAIAVQSLKRFRAYAS